MKLVRNFLKNFFPTLGLKNSPTVRYAFSFLFSIFAIVSIAAVSGSKGSYIKITSSMPVVEVGTKFSLDVYVFADVPINTVDISLLYPEDTIEILGIDKGSSVITIWAEEPVVKNNSVILRGGTFKRGFVGEHKIATIKVMAKKAGTAQFFTDAVNLLAGDGKGTTVKADSTQAKITTSIYEVGEKPAGTIFEGSVSVIVVTDIDGDGTVTLRDISAFMSSWTNQEVKFDFNNDGKMTFRDFSIILADYFSK